jgi:hypothetical protein
LAQTSSTATTWSALLTELHTVKSAARVATTANIASLSGGAPSSVDGKTLFAGDRVLVINQTSTAQNGLYTVQTVGTGSNGTWVRASDADQWVKLLGAIVNVYDGTANGGTQWRSTAGLGGSLGSTALTFTRLSGRPNEALSGLSSNGFLAYSSATNTFTARSLSATSGISITDPDGINANPAIGIATTYSGQGSITTVGTLTGGSWNASVIGAAFGGTGLSSYTTGDILYASGTALVRRSIGSAGQVLTVSGGVPVWNDIATTLGYTPASVGGSSFSGAIGIIAGSASAPGLYINGSTTTGLYSPAANQLAITAGGSARLVANASGVGIGTLSPAFPLDVSGTFGMNGMAVFDASRNLSATQANFTGTASAAAFIPTSTTAPTTGLYLAASNALGFATSGNARLVIAAGGNVGIGGVTSPSATLAVSGTLRLGNYASDPATAGLGAGTIYYHTTSGLRIFDGANWSALGGGGSSAWTALTGVPNSISALSNTTGAAGALMYFTSPTAMATLPIGSAGQFLKTSGSVPVWSSLSVSDVSGAAPLASPTFTGLVTLPAGSAALPGLTFTGAGLDTGFWSPGADTLAISISGTERLRVAADGKIGIGTSSPQATMHLSGSLRVEGNSTLSGVVTVGNYATAPAGSAGSIYFDTASKALKVHDGTGWGSLGGGTCDFSTSPTNCTSTLFSNLETSGDVTVGGTAYAASFVPTSTTAPSIGMYLFSQTDLAFATSQTPRMVIAAGGNVGIGVTAPSAKLHVSGTVMFSNLTTSATNRAVCINTVDGEIRMSTTTSCSSSDARFKINVEPVRGALSLLNAMEPVRYNWNIAAYPSMGFQDRRDIGFIAQQIEPILPEVVFTDSAGYKSVEYGKITSLIVAGVQELDKAMTRQGELIVAVGDRVKTIEDWIGRADPRLAVLETFVTKTEPRLAKVEEFATQAGARVQKLEDWRTSVDARLATADEMLKSLSETSAKHATLLALFKKTDDRITLDVPNFQVSNFSAELAEIALIKTKKLEAETARIRELEAEKIKTSELGSGSVKGNRLFSGEKDLFVSLGESVPVFEVPTGSHFVVNASSDDGSYASATVISAGGVLNVTPSASNGITVVANGSSVALQAAGKQVSVSWLRTK